MGLTCFSELKSYVGQVLNDSGTERSTLVLEVSGLKSGVDYHSPLLKNSNLKKPQTLLDGTNLQESMQKNN
jgi:hypothetical protein